MADLLVWHYSPNGLFSVRSAYHLALSLTSSAGFSNDRWCRNSWRAVWQAHVPNKVKLFLWRAIRDILPTARNLRRRLSHEAVSCPFCDFSDESPIHMLLRCLFERQVWALSGLRCLPTSPFFSHYKSWNLLATTSRLLIHKAPNISSVSLHLPPLGIPPPSECIKLNFDGGVRDGGRALGVGVLARDSKGVCLTWLSLKLDRGGTAEMDEHFAAREAISLALRRRWKQVILEGDSSTLLHKLGSMDMELSVISPLVADIHSLSSQFESVSFSLVSRVCNSAADLLARLALNQGTLFGFPLDLLLLFVVIWPLNSKGVL
ncbi:UNVERIFIED_CONTAM: hypothetical protein Sangu_2313300 [Sesamum angustifolium]|uniref:Reverse transcriptase zinc-binding domain-containing protein n=1 Tax=Sesamum angustifolium TaxID=2727405 RepID=A0AAW2L6R3_9LAMI